MGTKTEIVHQEKLQVPVRNWALAGTWLALLIYFIIADFNFVGVGLVGLVFISQVLHIVNYFKTKYVLTLDCLEFWNGNILVKSVDIKTITALKKGVFRSLIKEPEFKDIPSQNTHAVPKLGGYKDVSLLIYEENGEKHGLFFYPTLALHIAMENIIARVRPNSNDSQDS